MIVVFNSSYKQWFSILDLKMASKLISPKITKWSVSEEESLNNQRYVIFTLNTDALLVSSKRIPKGWNHKKIDKLKLNEVLVDK